MGLYVVVKEHIPLTVNKQDETPKKFLESIPK